ncbi:hypothetical protein M885DRAFT_556549 [Pelagophyceae sp. CCMP2097]|nr:hypothetical protein M885DRAFT_556549 [Pelagophyceae sp. CCMP2097]|mmetsp:Transcript_18086/g.62460  ORF Transcript_18086/g.62460 Transcript_18086/m.62460 type:complete len:410 (+) Transcript_18086:445-1674(+)
MGFLLLAALALRLAAAKFPVEVFSHHQLKSPPDAASPLPDAFSWRRVKGFGSVLAASSNQHVPVYCGACFAFASFHVLQDRVKIARLLYDVAGTAKFSGPDLMAAHQTMLNCGKDVAGSCATGGSAPGVWRWVEEFGGVPVAGCQPYQASDAFDCEPINICRDCMPAAGAAWTVNGTDSCFAVPGDVPLDQPCAGEETCSVMPYPRISVDDYGTMPSASVIGAAEAARGMQLEISRAGPIACDVDALVLLSYKMGPGGQASPLVAVDPLGERTAADTDHVIELVGWGVADDGMPYWEIRNSWGEYWGDDGFARVRRGFNDMLIEERCHWVHASGWGVPGTHFWQTHAAATTPVSPLMQHAERYLRTDSPQPTHALRRVFIIALAVTLLNVLISYKLRQAAKPPATHHAV